MMTQHIHRLAEFVTGTNFEDLPSDLVEKAKRHILDTFGATLAGASSDIVKSAKAAFHIHETGGDAEIWGTSDRMSPRNAAFINGIAAHAYELDDSGGCDHSGAVVIPALMAALASTNRQVSGKEFIIAVVIGYEVGRRVLEACGGYSPHNSAGWHSTSTCGVFGAAATSARILGLDKTQTISALGISASFSGGLWAFIHDGSLSKRLHTGRAAEGGLLAVFMAEQDITGPTQVFDDVWGGFLRTMAGDDAVPEALSDTLGNIWKLNRCSIKPYASCRGTHSAVDAIGIIQDQLNIGPDDIKEITVEMCSFLMDMCGDTKVSSLAASQMSLPYALAAVLTYGGADLDAYSDEKRNAPEIVPWFKKIKLVINNELSKDGEPIVTVITNDGRSKTICVETPLGAPDNQVTDDQLTAKFLKLATLSIPSSQANELMKRITNLEEISNVNILNPLLST